jgi:DNA-binding transcriptional ArsR family regulator
MSETPASLLSQLDIRELKQATKVFRAVNHPLRLSIIRLVEENERLTVTQIYFKLRIEQSVASQHLAILRESDVLHSTREGKNIHYSLNKPKLEAILQAVDLLRTNHDDGNAMLTGRR